MCLIKSTCVWPESGHGLQEGSVAGALTAPCGCKLCTFFGNGSAPQTRRLAMATANAKDVSSRSEHNGTVSDRLTWHTVGMGRTRVRPMPRCPTCGAKPGEKCELSTGQPRNTPHRDRRLAMKEHIGTQAIQNPEIRL